MQELLAAAAELSLEASDEVEGGGREHFARPSHHRALDLYLLNGGQRSANVHDARYVPVRRSTTGANDSAASPGRIGYEIPYRSRRCCSTSTTSSTVPMRKCGVSS